jgi:hypothetical protein
MRRTRFVTAPLRHFLDIDPLGYSPFESMTKSHCEHRWGMPKVAASFASRSPQWAHGHAGFGSVSSPII